MEGSNEHLAERIAEVSSISHDDALAALSAGGRLRESALSILRTAERYEQDRRSIDESRRKLRETVAA
jgi:hypothetical protein